ncbi:MAG: cysteine desulfurase family protein [Candidatus Nanopelagicaceae bacterium]
MSGRIYFDHAATTAISPRALEVVTEQMAVLGNPSSLHFDGRKVRDLVEGAREEIAHAIGSTPSEVIFTASGTEANNSAIKGLFWHRAPRRVIVTTPIEHHAVADPIQWLAEHDGAVIREVAVGRDGAIDIADLTRIVEADRESIALVALIHTNNEIGTSINDGEMKLIRSVLGEIPLHLDAVQSIGKVPFNFHGSGATSAAISAHKVGGPLGVAALLLRRGLDITPLLHGGGQERDIRSGTLNAPGIAGFAAAISESIERLEEHRAKISTLRKKLIAGIERVIPDVRVNGRGDAPGILNITFPESENEASLLLFDSEGISCSTGSACSQGLAQPSHVLLGIGMDVKDVNATLRFSLSHLNTEDEIERFLAVVSDVVSGARAAFRAKLPSVSGASS